MTTYETLFENGEVYDIPYETVKNLKFNDTSDMLSWCRNWMIENKIPWKEEYHLIIYHNKQKAELSNFNWR